MDSKTAPNKLAELRVVGLDDAATHPDGLWLSLGPTAEFVDVVAIEHCGSRQNFYDKRSRYMPNLHARMLLLPDGWLEQEITVQAGGRKFLRDICAKFPVGMTGEQRLPVRNLRVLYALHPQDYDTLHLTPFSAHEFFCPHGALAQTTSPKLREFVKRLSTDVHWYIR